MSLPPASRAAPGPASTMSRRRHPRRMRNGGPRTTSVVRAMIVAASLAATPLFAQTALPPAAMADTQLADPRQEAAARALMETLRCLVCQGQSIADSNADMAGDMRSLVRKRIAAGESPGEVRRWLIARYGDYVSYDPPLNVVTAALWLTPIALLAAGLLIARGSFKRRPR